VGDIYTDLTTELLPTYYRTVGLTTELSN